MIIALLLILLGFSVPVRAQDECICPAQVHGPQIQLTGLQDDELAAKIAPNSLDGSYFIGWLSIQDFSDNEEATIVQGQIYDRLLQPISSRIIFENNQRHTAGDPVLLAGAVFNAQRREYFIVTGNVAFTPSGTKYSVLKGFIVSDKGIVKKGNIILADTRALPGSFISYGQTEVIFNSVNREYVVQHLTFVGEQRRTVLQSFDEQGVRQRKTIVFRSGDLRFNLHANQYLFASSGIVNGNFEIKAQLFNSHLKKIGPLNTVLSVPYVFTSPYQYTGPFPVYNPARRKYVIFWYEGPWNNSKIFERSLSNDGKLGSVFATGLDRRLVDVRFNPSTEGYILITRSREVVRIDSVYRITSTFPFTCEKPGLAPPSIAYNRFSPEILLVWFYPVASGKNIDLYARRVAASIPTGTCN